MPMRIKRRKKTDTINLYNIDPETKAYMIEVSLEDYSELFNGWDASPLRRKDLEPELIDYLEQAATEIPKDENVELVFYLPQNMKDPDKESKSLAGIRNNFKFVIFLINKTLRLNYRQLAAYIMLSILFLIGAYVFRNIGGEYALFVSIMVEGLFIGGWFLLWEAFSLFFFESHETRLRKKLYQKMLSSNIYFKDTLAKELETTKTEAKEDAKLF